MRMKIINDLLSTINFESPLRDIRQEPFQTATLRCHCQLIIGEIFYDNCTHA